MCVRIVAAGNLSLSLSCLLFCFFFPLFFLDERRNGRSSNLGTHCSVSHGFFFFVAELCLLSSVPSRPINSEGPPTKIPVSLLPFFQFAFRQNAFRRHGGWKPVHFWRLVGRLSFVVIEYFNINKKFDFYHQQLLPVD